MFDDGMAELIGTAIGEFFETTPERMPTLIKLTQMSLIFFGLAAISFAVNTWTAYRVGTRGKKNDL